MPKPDDNFCWENLPEIERIQDDAESRILRIWRDKRLTLKQKQALIVPIAREASAKVDALWSLKTTSAAQCLHCPATNDPILSRI